MSGRKYVTVDSNELANLRRDASQLRALRADLPERLENDIRQVQQGINNRLAPIEARQRDYARALQGVSSNIAIVEQNMANKIAEQAKNSRVALQQVSLEMEKQQQELRKELQITAQQLEEQNLEVKRELTKQIQDTGRRVEQVNHELQQRMIDQEQRLGEAINQERIEREKAINQVHSRVDQIIQGREEVITEAKKNLDAAKVIRDFISSNYHHEVFTPHELSTLEKNLHTAKSNISLAPEAALAEANIVYQGLSDLRLKLESLDSEWRFLRENALQRAAHLLVEVEANKHNTGITEESTVSEVDYWTENKLSMLEKELRSMKSQLDDQENIPLTISDLRKVVEETLPGMNCRLDCILVEANDAVISSQIRTNIADLAMQALEEIGYSVQGGVFEGDDTRGSFVAIGENVAGSAVVVSVIPEGNKNKVIFDTIEANPRTPDELLTQSKEVAQAIREQGFQVTEPVMESEQPSLENRDLKEVQKRKIPKKQVQNTQRPRNQ